MWTLKLLYFIAYGRLAFIGRFFGLFLFFQGITKSQLGIILGMEYLPRAIATIFWSALSDRSCYHRYMIPQIVAAISGLSSLLYLIPHYWLHYNYNSHTYTGNSVHLFLYLLIVQCVWFLFTTIELPMILASTMIELSHTNNKIKYGIYRSYGAISWGLMHLLIGFCLQFKIVQLFHLLYIYCAVTPLFLITNYITFGRNINNLSDRDPLKSTNESLQNYGTTSTDDESCISSSTSISRWSTLKYIFSNSSTFSAFILIFCSGGGRNVLKSFLFVYIYDGYWNDPFLYGLLGISVFVTIIFEFPMFMKEKWLVKRFGFRNLMIYGSTFLIIRFVGYTLLTGDTLIFGLLVIELCHGVSFALIDMSIATICSDVFPNHMQSIGQGILYATKSNIGPFVFVIVSGFAFDKYGGVWFRVLAVLQTAVLVQFIIFTKGGKLKSDTEMELSK